MINVIGVIVFGSDQEVAELMKAVKRRNATGQFFWIGSDGWSARALVSDGKIITLWVVVIRNWMLFVFFILNENRKHRNCKACRYILNYQEPDIKEAICNLIRCRLECDLQKESILHMYYAKRLDMRLWVTLERLHVGMQTTCGTL